MKKLLVLLLLCALPTLAGFSAKVGSFTMNTSTGNQAITGVGFTPKIVLFFVSNRTSDGSDTNAVFSFGAAVSSSDQRSMGTDYLERTGANGLYSNNTKCFRMLDTTGTFNVLVDVSFVSQDADGFTINLVTADSRARIANYIALGGSDLSTKTGEGTVATTNTTKAYTGVGFKPDCILMFFPTYLQTAQTTGGTNMQGAIGWGTSSSAQSYLGSRIINNATPSDTKKVQVTDATFGLVNSGSLVDKGAISTLDADGFTISYSSVNGTADYFYYIALKGVQFKVGSFNQSTSTGNQSVTGMGFLPSVILAQSDNAATSASVANDQRWTFGATDGTNQFSMWTGVNNNVVVKCGKGDMDRTKVFKTLTPVAGGPTTQTSATVVSLDADGYTWNNGTTDATSRQILYLGIGALGGGAATAAGRESLLGVGQ